MLVGFFFYAGFDVYADPSYGTTTIDLPFLGETGGVAVIGVGSLLLGVVLMLIQQAVSGSWFRNPDIPTGAATTTDTAAR